MALAIRSLDVPVKELARNTSWQLVVEAFLEAGVDSPHTRRAYRRHLYRAFTSLGVASLAGLNGAMLASYRAAVTSSQLAPGSQAQALAAIRSFLAWSRSMGAHGLYGEVVHAALRTPRVTVRKPYQVLSEPEVAAVLAAADSPRDVALLAVLLGAGLRVSEASGLDVKDLVVDQDGEAALYVRQGKGRKDRVVPVQLEVAGAVRAYLQATGRSMGDSGPLFRAHDRAAHRLTRGRLTPQAIADVVHKCARIAGVTAKRITPHSCRHTYALRSLRAGSNIVAVSKLLGHSSITTTQRYLDHLELGELRAAVPHLPMRDSSESTHSPKPGAV